MKTTYFALLLAALCFLSACANLSKLVEKKKYEKAIDVATNRFKNSSKRDPADVTALETAFNQALDKDLKMIQYLKDENREENWLRINDTYKKIGSRQQKVQSVSPVVDDNGRRAVFNFINVEAEMSESTAKSAELFYNKAVKLLNESISSGDRLKARDAFQEFVNMEKYDKNFQDGQALKANALERGKTNVYVQWVDNTGKGVFMNADSLFPKTLFTDSDWVFYHRQAGGKTLHYTVNLTLKSTNITPNTNDSREFTETASIQDGVEFVRDSNGQLVLDSKGDPVTTPKMVDVSCVVKEIRHNKTATLTAVATITDHSANNNVIAQQGISSNGLFEHFTANILSGDPRAASAATNEKLKNRPPTFPTDEAVIYLAAPNMYAPFRSFFATHKAKIK